MYWDFNFYCYIEFCIVWYLFFRLEKDGFLLKFCFIVVIDLVIDWFRFSGRVGAGSRVCIVYVGDIVEEFVFINLFFKRKILGIVVKVRD